MDQRLSEMSGIAEPPARETLVEFVIKLDMGILEVLWRRRGLLDLLRTNDLHASSLGESPEYFS